MLPLTLSTFIRLPFVVKIFILSICEWLFHTGLTVLQINRIKIRKECSTVKPVLSSHSKRRSKVVFKTNYGLMKVKSIAEILSTFIKLSFVIKLFILSICGWPFYTGFTVLQINRIKIREECSTVKLFRMTRVKGERSGRVLDSRLRGRGIEPHWGHCVVALSKTH